MDRPLQAAAPPLRLSERLDRLPVLPFHWRLLALCGAGWILDSVDTGLVGFVIADLTPRWSLSRAAAGWVMSAGMAGLFAGSVLSGFLADRWGRRPVFVNTPLLFALGALLCGLAWDAPSLAAFRFLLGLSLGGEFPVGGALMAEYAPAAQRGRLLVLLDSFWAYGSVLASLIALLVIPGLGWRAAFLINVAPGVAVALLRRRVPESVRYLVLHGRAGEAQATVAALERAAGLGVAAPAAEKAHPQPRAHWGHLFAAGAALRTLRLWAIWFSMTFVYVGLSSWLPTILVDSGYDLKRSFGFMLWITLAQVPGYLTAALLVDRWGRRRSLVTFTIGAGIAGLLFSRAVSPGEVLLWGCWMSYFNLAAWGILFAYTGEQFPTRLRAIGGGSCTALGRLGGILSPLTAAAILEAGGEGRTAVLALFGGLLLLSALAAGIGRETRGQSLESLHGH
jgi:putative MFS transporter